MSVQLPVYPFALFPVSIPCRFCMNISVLSADVVSYNGDHEVPWILP
jgi:hypothetical protein